MPPTRGLHGTTIDGTRARRRVLLVFVLRNAANYSATAAAAALRTYLTMGLPLGPTTMAV